MTEFFTAYFWVALGQIILIDILLGGDNAVVIALACRKLPVHQRTKAIVWGTVGAIVVRVALIAVALELLQVPFLKTVGAALLVWIGIKLVAPEDEDDPEVKSSDKLWGAVRTVIMADIIMSIDNVIGIAGAAQNAGERHTLPLVTLGLLISIPIIVAGSQIVLRLMERFPVVILLGGMLLGWIAGSMMHSDPGLDGWIPRDPVWHYGMACAGALLVLAAGYWLRVRRASGAEQNAGGQDGAPPTPTFGQDRD